MTALRQYLFSLICTCLICAVVPVLGGSGGKKILRLICSVVITIAVVSPLVGFDPGQLLQSICMENIELDASHLGQQQANEAMASIIKAETEAYILDKAGQEGVSLSVSVTLDKKEPPVPVSVTLQGTPTQDQKNRLTRILSEDLGIPKEAQLWIGG